MPRDSSGNYTLPAGNPVVDGTVIETTWANPTMSDIAAQLNNVITRDGLLQSLAPLRGVNGTAAAPAYSFSAAPSYGMYYGTSTLSISVAGGDQIKITSSALSFFNNGDMRGQFHTAPGFHIGDAVADPISSAVGLYVRPRLVSAVTQQYGVLENTMFSASTTQAALGFNSQSRFADGAYACAAHYGMRIQAPVPGVGMTITANTGVLIQNSAVAATETGLEIATTAGVGKKALYVSGNADSVFNGNVSAANLLSGVYTPVGTAIANCTGVTPAQLQYMRVGNVVTVSGRVDLTVTTVSVNTSLRLSLPIPSAFISATQLGGAGSPANPTANYAVAVYADNTNDEALIRFLPNVTGVAQLTFSFTYSIV